MEAALLQYVLTTLRSELEKELAARGMRECEDRICVQGAWRESRERRPIRVISDLATTCSRPASGVCCRSGTKVCAACPWRSSTTAKKMDHAGRRDPGRSPSGALSSSQRHLRQPPRKPRANGRSLRVPKQAPHQSSPGHPRSTRAPLAMPLQPSAEQRPGSSRARRRMLRRARRRLLALRPRAHLILIHLWSLAQSSSRIC